VHARWPAGPAWLAVRLNPRDPYFASRCTDVGTWKEGTSVDPLAIEAF